MQYKYCSCESVITTHSNAISISEYKARGFESDAWPPSPVVFLFLSDMFHSRVNHVHWPFNRDDRSDMPSCFFFLMQHFEVSLRSYKNHIKIGWRRRESRRKKQKMWLWWHTMENSEVSRGSWSWKHPNWLPWKATAVVCTECGMGQQGLTSQGCPGVITLWAVQHSHFSIKANLTSAQTIWLALDVGSF